MADTSRYGVVSHNFLFSSVSVFSAFHNRNLVSFFTSVFLPAFSSNVGGEEEEEEA